MMYDTYVTIVGNVMTAPEWRRTKNTGSLVAHFKVASTARRLDRESGQWVDGNSLRVRVNCWRRLAEGVGNSLITGDPVIVVGRLYTRDWLDENENRRIGYELEAVAVGHDLSRGQSRFVRNRPAMSTSTVEEERDDQRVGGELTVAVPAHQVPPRRDDREFGELPSPMPAPMPAQAAGNGGYDVGALLGGDDGDVLVGEDESLGAADDFGREPAGELGDVALDGGAPGGDLDGAALSVHSGGEELAGGQPRGGDLGGRDLVGDGPASAGPLAGDESTSAAESGEEPRGRGRRRGRTAVPV
jgi:single-strand DNA-binding protein